MKKIKINIADEVIYKEVLDNGMEVYIYPKKIETKIASITTKYGGMHIDFLEHGNKNYTSVPPGIAHFLEHVLFQKKEEDKQILKLFNELGMVVNASTSPARTEYHFSATDNFKEGLDILFDFVFNPTFDKEEIEKERNVILEEMKMYKDNPYEFLDQNIKTNIINKHPFKHKIIGTEESVASITVEQLYTCHNAFYVPSNMFITIIGDVEPAEVLEQINEFFTKNNKNYNPVPKLKNYKENIKISTVKGNGKFDVNTNIVVHAIKFETKNKIAKDAYKEHIILDYIFSNLFNHTSDFYEKNKYKNLFTSLGYDILKIDNIIYVFILAETEKPNEILEEVNKQLKNLEIDKDAFQRNKKAKDAYKIMIYDNISYIDKIIRGQIIAYNSFNPNYIAVAKEITITDLENYIKKQKFNNHATFIVEKT